MGDDVRYALTAAILKLFSVSPRVYRFLANMIGTKKRVQAGLPEHYLRRAKRFLTLCAEHQAIQDGDRALEVGTGWVHWESIVLGLFYDARVTLFDVWDNRQLEAVKRWVAELEGLIRGEIDADEAQIIRMHDLVKAILKADSFDDLYRALGFQYVIDERGTLSRFQRDSFDLVFSHSVLQHVEEKIAPKLIQDFHRVLKPGGLSIHQVNLCDQLAYFAGTRTMCAKNYLKYSEKTWKRYFENRVQYFNRIQHSEWLALFGRTGLELVNEETWSCDISTLEVASVYEPLERHDLECSAFLVVHRKPNG